MAYDWSQVLDPSSAALLAFALAVIAGGSSRSGTLAKYALTRPLAELDTETVVTGRTALMFPIFSSIALVTLFFFVDSLFSILVLLFCISSVYSLFFVLTPLLEALKQTIGKRILSLPTELVVFAPFVVFSLGWWLLYSHWIILDVLAAVNGICSIAHLRLPSLKIAILLTVLFLVYDVFWVFCSPQIFGESVMVSVAQKVVAKTIPLPALVVFPRLHSPGFTMLGLGDIILPGILISFLRAADMHAGALKAVTRPALRLPGYYPVGLASYCVGFAVTLAMLVYLDTPQPALLWLVPSVVIPVLAWSLVKGDFLLLFHGLHSTPAVKSEEEGDRCSDADAAQLV